MRLHIEINNLMQLEQETMGKFDGFFLKGQTNENVKHVAFFQTDIKNRLVFGKVITSDFRHGTYRYRTKKL